MMTDQQKQIIREAAEWLRDREGDAMTRVIVREEMADRVSVEVISAYVCISARTIQELLARTADCGDCVVGATYVLSTCDTVMTFTWFGL